MSQKKTTRVSNDNGNILLFQPQPDEVGLETDALCSAPEYEGTSLVFESAADAPLTNGVAIGLLPDGCMYIASDPDQMSAGDTLMMLERAKRFLLDWEEGLLEEIEDEDADFE